MRKKKLHRVIIITAAIVVTSSAAGRSNANFIIHSNMLMVKAIIKTQWLSYCQCTHTRGRHIIITAVVRVCEKRNSDILSEYYKFSRCRLKISNLRTARRIPTHCSIGSKTVSSRRKYEHGKYSKHEDNDDEKK